MSAIDLCEPQMVRALEKAGWVVINQPYSLVIQEREFIYADLRLVHEDNGQLLIVVEVKCFADAQIELREFYQSIGQYMTYRAALRYMDKQMPLYLAIPEEAYRRLSMRKLVQIVLEDVKMSIIRVDLEREEIVAWSS